MKIKIEGEDRTTSVERYMDRALESYSPDNGRFEDISDKVDNAARALGRLCEVLMDKKLLTLDDLQRVAGGYKNIERMTE